MNLPLIALNTLTLGTGFALWWTNLLFIPFQGDVTFITWGLAAYLVYWIVKANFAHPWTFPVSSSDLHTAANIAVTLGFLGTVIGFAYALYGLDPNAIADVEQIPALVSQMLAGMGTAMYTTIVGVTTALLLEAYGRAIQ